MVQNDIHRTHVLVSLRLGKIKDARWFLGSLLAIVQGCVRKLFFACSGNGNGSSWNNRGGNGNYWSASFNSAVNARNLNFNSGGVNPQNWNNRYNGFAVRAVQHTLLIILSFFLMYGTDTSATPTRPVSSLLRCETSQIESVLCQEMGEESQKELGRAVRRFVLSQVQASSVEVLHRGLPEEEGDIRCHVQGPHRTSSILQLLSWPVRKDIHTGHLQLHQESWHSLWHRESHGFLPQGVEELAAQVLCDAPRHQGLLHAHSPQEALGDCNCQSEKDGDAPYLEVFRADMGRRAGYGLRDMAHRGDNLARPQGKLHHLWLERGLDWSGPCQVDAESDGWSWPSHRQPDESAILECVPERVRPVHETRIEMQVLWPLCGRCRCGESRQGMAVVVGSSHQGVPENGAWLGASHGQAGDFGGASWRGVPWCIHQALAHLYLEPLAGAYQEEDCGVRLYEALEGCPFREQLPRYLTAYGIIQVEPEAVDDKRHIENRHIRQGYDQDYRQETIL